MKYFEIFSAEIFGFKYFFDRNPRVFLDISARFFDRFPHDKIEQFCSLDFRSLSAKSENSADCFEVFSTRYSFLFCRESNSNNSVVVLCRSNNLRLAPFRDKKLTESSLTILDFRLCFIIDILAVCL